MPNTPSAANAPSTSGSGTRRGAICTTSSMPREAATTPAVVPIRSSAISLPNPVLDPSRWGPVLSVVHDRLLTPVGLRSLAPGSPDYKARYFGDLRARDAAYHQGTVWAWLIGPFVDAWLKVHPDDRAGAGGSSTAWSPTSTTSASARSPRSSTPSPPSPRAVASPRPGASPRRSAA